MLELIILATVIVSLISLIGVVIISASKNVLKTVVLMLVALAAGTLLGDAFFHMLPESLEEGGPASVFGYTLFGFVLFFVIEKFLRWRHCHDEDCELHHSQGKVHPIAYLNLIGDGVHNFIDGVILATSFLANVNIGIATTVAIVLHEIPQELSDFGVLLHSGLSPRKALLYNLLSGLTAVAGAIVAYYSVLQLSGLTSVLVPVSAGGFLYIAAVDLTPELHKERGTTLSILQFTVFLVGIAIMYFMKIFLGG